MLARRLLSVLCFAFVTISMQAQTSDVIAGPYGVPHLVRNEGERWEAPIRVYEDSRETMLVPDLTSQGWRAWHKTQFQANGIYFTYLYIYAHQSRKTGRMLITVDTKNSTIAMRMQFSATAPNPIATLPPDYQAAVRKITAIVENEFARSKSEPSIEDSANQQRLVTLWLYMCGGLEPRSAECAAGFKAFAKNHPIHASSIGIAPSMPAR